MSKYTHEGHGQPWPDSVIVTHTPGVQFSSPYRLNTRVVNLALDRFNLPSHYQVAVVGTLASEDVNLQNATDHEGRNYHPIAGLPSMRGRVSELNDKDYEYYDKKIGKALFDLAYDYNGQKLFHESEDKKTLRQNHIIRLLGGIIGTSVTVTSAAEAWDKAVNYADAYSQFTSVAIFATVAYGSVRGVIDLSKHLSKGENQYLSMRNSAVDEFIEEYSFIYDSRRYSEDGDDDDY